MKGLLILFTLTTFSIYAQNDKKPTSVVIPRSMDRETDANKAPAARQEEAKENSMFNPLEFKPIKSDFSDFKIEKPNQGYKIGENSENKFNQTEKFQSPHKLQREIAVKRYNEDDSKVYRRNQSFGELRTKSEFVKLRFKDYAAVDGDRVKIMVNGLTIRADISLIEAYQTIEVGLTPGFNKLEFEALNQGYSGPNTAQFSVVDDTGKVLLDNRWDLATGFKGSVMIIKE